MRIQTLCGSEAAQTHVV